MSNPAGIIGLTYDGDDLQAADFTLFLTITQGLNETPEVRGRDVLVPYLDGEWARPRRVHNRRIVLTGHVMGTGATEADRQAAYRGLIRYLNDLFDPTKDPANLVATLEDGDTATIAARPLPGILVAERVPSEWATVSVELSASDPTWVYA